MNLKTRLEKLERLQPTKKYRPMQLWEFRGRPQPPGEEDYFADGYIPTLAEFRAAMAGKTP